MEVLGQMQQIAQDAPRSYCSACACALHYKWSNSIPFGMKGDDIIRTTER